MVIFFILFYLFQVSSFKFQVLKPHKSILYILYSIFYALFSCLLSLASILYILFSILFLNKKLHCLPPPRKTDEQFVFLFTLIVLDSILKKRFWESLKQSNRKEKAYFKIHFCSHWFYHECEIHILQSGFTDKDKSVFSFPSF